MRAAAAGCALSIAAFAACGTNAPVADAAADAVGDELIAPATPGAVASRLAAVDDWVYQLQGRAGDLTLGPLIATAYDLAVIDYSADGSVDGEHTAASIATLREGGRLAIAYVSIGEAEADRFYFAELPEDLLVGANPAFPDNFKVVFCDARWQEIIVGVDHAPGAPGESYLDRILGQGFDGIYLDIVEGYRFFTPGCATFCPDECEGPTAAADMVAFVDAIARHAREIHGVTDFLVLPQNAADILFELADEGAAYLATVDGIGQEDAFYFDEEDTLAVDGPLAPQCETVLPALDRFVAAGKPVLAVDYLSRAAKIDDFYTRALRRGYVPFAAPSRDLDSAAVVPGHPPD
jgi:cysteinyl-tRNA synthetase